MRSTVVFLALGIAFGAVSPSPASAHPVVLAKPDAKKAKPAGKSSEPGPTDVDKKIKLSPDGLRFGMTLEEIAKLYEKVFDDEFVPLYKTVEPGPRMSELDSELADKKQLLIRNKLEFGSLPSGLDNTPIGGEYTYNNGESMSQVKLRSGVQRYFFFFGNHLWKVYDVHKLGKKSKLGADFDGAVEGLGKQFGKPPRVRKADPSVRRFVDQVDWQDKETIVRVLDHANGSAAVAYVDRKIEEGIDKFRSNKGDRGEALDHDVSDVTRRGDAKAEDKNKNVTDAYAKKKK
jgi:hypothetical protein